MKLTTAILIATLATSLASSGYDPDPAKCKADHRTCLLGHPPLAKNGWLFRNGHKTHHVLKHKISH